jgi:hypothetical protein
VGAVASALLERALPRASEATYVLKSVIFAAVGLLSAHPWMLGAANAGAAALLFLVHDDGAGGVRGAASGVVEQLNRSAGHLEGLFTWLVLAVWWAPSLPLQVTGVLAVIAAWSSSQVLKSIHFDASRGSQLARVVFLQTSTR